MKCDKHELKIDQLLLFSTIVTYMVLFTKTPLF